MNTVKTALDTKVLTQEYLLKYRIHMVAKKEHRCRDTQNLNHKSATTAAAAGRYAPA